jgi:hypothetical protein
MSHLLIHFITSLKNTITSWLKDDASAHQVYLKRIFMKYIVLLTLLLLLPQHAAIAAIYQCKIDGVTSFSQTPCEASDSKKGVYHPKAPILTYTPNQSPTTVQAKKKNQVNTMDASDAIVIKQQRCENGTYTVVMKNISTYSTYSTTVDVTFNYFKPDRAKKVWDKRKQTIVLKPRQQREFILKGRAAPSSYDMECVANRSVKFVDSIVSR